MADAFFLAGRIFKGRCGPINKATGQAESASLHIAPHWAGLSLDSAACPHEEPTGLPGSGDPLNPINRAHAILKAF
jgi:hypothetical protein